MAPAGITAHTRNLSRWVKGSRSTAETVLLALVSLLSGSILERDDDDGYFLLHWWSPSWVVLGGTPDTYQMAGLRRGPPPHFNSSGDNVLVIGEVFDHPTMLEKSWQGRRSSRRCLPRVGSPPLIVGALLYLCVTRARDMECIDHVVEAESRRLSSQRFRTQISSIELSTRFQEATAR